MARFKCPYGHVEADPAHPGQMKPLVHNARTKCSIYVQLRAQGKVDFWGRPIPGQGPPGSTPPVIDAGSAADKPQEGVPPESGGAASPAASGAPGDRPQKEPLLKRLKSGLQVAYNRVDVTPPDKEGLAEADTSWEVSGETSVRFWQTIFGFVETVCNLVTSWLDDGHDGKLVPPVPKEVFVVDAGQEFVFRTALKGFTTNLLKKVFRAKSPEDADRVVAGLSGLLGFGMMGMKVFIHFATHAPKSPRLAKLKAKVAANNAARAKRKADELTAQGKEVPESLAKAAAGVAA